MARDLQKRSRAKGRENSKRQGPGLAAKLFEHNKLQGEGPVTMTRSDLAALLAAVYEIGWDHSFDFVVAITRPEN